jgi:tRNA pseudouridine38-40 synthase
VRVEPGERNIRLLVEYVGTNYVGWQAQENGPSIQAELTRCLEDLTSVRPALHVAGRTDAGVHALGQVVSFVTHSRIPPDRFAAALNQLLPDDISIHRSDEVSMDFDARHSARGKRYRYRVYLGPQPAALESPRAWYVRRALDLEAMRAATRPLLGEPDFEAFRSAPCDAPHAIRRMHAISLETSARPPVGQYVDMTFHADAFCRHMCRILAGTLVEVGLGRRTASSIEATLLGRKRELAGITAPAQGLTLLEVFYEP